MADEKTSARVGSIAARLINMTDAEICQFVCDDPGAIRSVAASAMTQRPDRKRPLLQRLFGGAGQG